VRHALIDEMVERVNRQAHSTAVRAGVAEEPVETVLATGGLVE
jgi:hypothetical protein